MKIPERLRILIMGNLAPHAIGGAEMQARRLSRHFAARGHHVTVIGHANANATVDKGRYSGRIVSVHLPTIRKNRLTRAVTFAVSLGTYLLLRRNRFDILMTLIIGESSLVAASIKKAGLLRPPLIVSSACAGSTGDAAGLKRLPATPFLVRMLNQACDAILILSPSIEKELADIGIDRNRFAPIACGVPIGPQKQSPPISENNPGFLFVGRLRAEKAVDNLLAAVHQLVEGGYNPQVHIVGDGPQEGRLKSMTRSLGIEPHITFHGLVPPDRVGGFFERDTVFVLPSINEGQPNALLEAMGAGCPVIVTRSGGSEYLVDSDRGMVCPPSDSRALASAMRAMIQAGPGRRAAMGSACRAFVLKHFSESGVGDRYLELFAQVLQKSEDESVKVYGVKRKKTTGRSQ